MHCGLLIAALVLEAGALGSSNCCVRLQALLQSLPQLILLAIAMSPGGPVEAIRGTGPRTCNPPLAPIIVALVVASLNVLDKLVQCLLQVRIIVALGVASLNVLDKLVQCLLQVHPLLSQPARFLEGRKQSPYSPSSRKPFSQPLSSSWTTGYCFP